MNSSDITIHRGKLGIALSGGADSAIVLYALMAGGADEIHVYTCSSKEKNRRGPRYAMDVIDKCCDLTGYTNVFHHIYQTPKQTLPALIDPLSKFIIQHRLDHMYTGITALPPDDAPNDIAFRSSERGFRDPNEIKEVYNGKWYRPLYNINKQEVANLYEEFGVMDSLFPVTRSCESLTLLDGHCGQCWWCEERLWGFGNL